MTPSYKTRLCLVLLVVLAAAAGLLHANSAPIPIPEDPTQPRQESGAVMGGVGMGGAGMGGAVVGGMGMGGGMSSAPIATSAGVATPARFTGWSFAGSDDASAELALVIPNKETDVATTSRTIEDLGIMSRIIEKNILTPYGVARNEWRDPFARVYGSADAGPRALFPSFGRPKPLYIAGYGATFFIRVDFPLLPPPTQTPEQPTQTQEDSVWAQTKQSLTESPETGVVQQGRPAGQPYNQARVEGFRKSLIGTMKHAANIRGLEAGEWVTFVVQGQGPMIATPVTSAGATNGIVLPAAGPVSTGRSVMTLRATKADVDAYAKGQLSPEQFEQKVQAITY